MTGGRRLPLSERWACAAFGVLLTVALEPTTGNAQQPSFDCVIDPGEQVRLGSPVTGVLAEVFVERGDFVERGQVIARLESAVEAASVAFDRARAEDTSEIEAQEARVALYKSRFARAAELVKKDIVAQERVEELRADVEVGIMELTRAETQKRLAELELARSNED